MTRRSLHDTNGNREPSAGLGGTRREFLKSTAAAGAVVAGLGVGAVNTVSAEIPTSPEEQWPFNGPHALPGRIDAVDFDEGGEGISYETERGGDGGEYRDEQVGIEQTPGGGYHLTNVAAGDWWEYTVEVEPTWVGNPIGTFRASVASADGFDGGSFDVYVNDHRVDSISFESTGDWHEFEVVEGTGETELSVGTNVVRIQTTSAEFNFAWFEFDAENVHQRPPAPSEVDVEAGDTSLDVTWEPARGIDSYHVYLDGGLLVSPEFFVSSDGRYGVTITELEPETTYRIDIASVGAGIEGERVTITATTGSDGEGPPSIGENQPADPDGDGLYDDVTGDGETTPNDVVAFFENVENLAVTDYPEYYDFDGNSAVSISDVIELFESL